MFNSSYFIKALKESYDAVPYIQGDQAAKVMVADAIKSHKFNPADVLSFICSELGNPSVKLDKAGEQIISFKADHPLSPAAVRATVAAAEAPAETTAPVVVTTAAQETTAEAVTTAAETTAAAATTAAATTTAGATAAPNGNAGTTKAAGASTGDSSAVPALAVTMLAAFGTALAMRRRTEK